MIAVEAPRYRGRLIAVAVLAAAAAGALWVARGATCRHASAPPSGYQPMELTDVTPAGSGYAVGLTDAHRSKIVTVYVGASEGLAITLRNEGRRYPRPLSMDLLDSVLRELGGELDHVQVDALRNGTFFGSLHLRQGARSLEIDARPSDAIALALGHHAPILVADEVIAVAGHDVVDR